MLFENSDDLLFNKKMLYILTNIFNLHQLEKLQTGLIEKIKTAINKIADIHKQLTVKEFNDIILIDAGNELSIDPQHIIEIAFHIKEILDAENKNLFGYNILITASREIIHFNIITNYKPLLLSLEEEELIWVSRDLKNFFREYAEFKSHGEYQIITEKRIPVKPQAESEIKKFTHLSSKDSLFSVFNTLVKSRNAEQVIHFYGTAGTGKSLIIEELINAVYPQDYAGLVPRNYIRFKKSSLIHPLLNGINVSLLNRIKDYLNPFEQSTWDEHGPLLQYLKSTTTSEICPDQIPEDFYICYNLYLTAYIKIMESHKFPALFICDDLDRYHKKSIQLLSTLVRDFIKNPIFIPIFINNHPALPDKLADFKVLAVKAFPANIKEIDMITRSQFPKLKLEKRQYKVIKQNTKGKLLPIIISLLYLDKLNSEKKPLSLPEKLEEILWYIIETLDLNAKDILYSIYVSGGLLPASELTNFLIAFGLKKEIIDKYIKLLSNCYLIYADIYLVPRYPYFRLKLEKHLGKRGQYLKDTISDFVSMLWRKKKLSNLVLLFSFYMNNNFPGLSFEVLSLLIKRKMDENDLQGVKPYLIVSNFTFPHGLNEQETHILNVIISTGKIRLYLIEDNLPNADKVAENIIKFEAGFLPDKFHGELFLNLSRFYIAQGEIETAVQNTKKNLITIQELGCDSLTGQSYKIMGYIMLITGRTDAAIDYSDLAEKFLNETTDPYERVQVLLLGAVTHFIRGNLSRAFSLANQGSKISATCARRNLELFFNFFKARIYFEYGSYNQALSLLQKNLSMTNLYSWKQARSVHYTWIARTEAFRGNAQVALNILDHLEANKENFYFKSEACYFLGIMKTAREAMEKALKLPDAPLPLSDETISWANGFDSIEGKCMSSNKDNIIFNRMQRAFCAFLQGVDGDPLQGITTLQSIIRSEKIINQDPNSHFYYQLYASLLYRNADPALDDSLTILNQAVKQLQERASKIDNPLARTEYLNCNYWNKKLLEEGKKRKLIL